MDRKSLYTISLLHPFSAKAIGLSEVDLYHSHSKSHELALRAIAKGKTDYSIQIDYFSEKWLPYFKSVNSITKRFFPVTKPINNDRSAWRRQHSLWHFFRKPSNLTIINMSGHGSKYCFKYADKLHSKGLPYIAMIGGIHMTTTGKALKYYQNAHHILVHTDMQRKELYKLKGFENLDIRVLPLGVDLSKFEANSNQKDSKKIRLLFVGRVMPLKRIEFAIETLAFLRQQGMEAQLDIVGFIPDTDYHSQLISLIKQLRVQKYVEFKGKIPQEKLVPYYQQASLLLLPSEHESFGMVMVEAMACGTPVAAIVGTGGPEEIIVHDYNGILMRKDTYLKGIYNLLSNEDKLNGLSSNCIQWVKKNYSLQTTTKYLEQSIEDSLKLR